MLSTNLVLISMQIFLEVIYIYKTTAIARIIGQEVLSVEIERLLRQSVYLDFYMN